MRATTSGDAFAAAHSAMIRGVDGASVVHVLLADCLRLVGADSAGVLLRVDGALELAAASSHQATELELHQAHDQEGPCVETIDTGRTVFASGSADLRARWPGFGASMAAGGFETVLASPMRWHELALGGLNLFWKAPRTPGQVDRDLAQAFADIAVLALMQSPASEDRPDTVGHRLRIALRGRVAIERAKGVLSHTDHLEMDEAFVRLVQIGEQTGRPLSQVAQEILDDVVDHRR
jgi:hypothetical protein